MDSAIPSSLPHLDSSSYSEVRRVMANEQVIKVDVSDAQRRNRISLYIAVGLGLFVLALYLVAFTVDWASLWRGIESS
jgi:hypothetical protein